MLDDMAIFHIHHPAGRLARHFNFVGDDNLVMPVSASSRMMLTIWAVISGSSAAVGSSNSRTCGSIISARAIATRCCWPPDKCSG